MWPLFIGIGVGFLLLLSYGWGMATGVKLGKAAQTRDHEAYRAAGQRALEAHRVEREAWLLSGSEAAQTGGQAQPPAPAGGLEGADDRIDRLPRAKEAAELAHARTREALLALRPAWGDYGATGDKK
ncbi:MAG: hypothetical protein JWN48_107 [Myxococcaceae bacterium]|nr:hypothetical protein [Myxococcaceae bacterium]